jgi:hypothetical protein
VRRFLDRFGAKVVKVCFCVDSADDLAMYAGAAAPALPPRSCSAADSALRLPPRRAVLRRCSTLPRPPAQPPTAAGHRHPLGCRYTALLPLYFARTQAEEAASVSGLPADVGDETGDAVRARLPALARARAAAGDRATGAGGGA